MIQHSRLQNYDINTVQKRKDFSYGFSRYFLLTALLSFIGWAYEVGVMAIQTGKFHNQGFMTLPFCPIYGCSLILTYLLLGTPDKTQGILKNRRNRRAVYALYLLCGFCIPTLAELIVGLLLSQVFHIRLWSYAHLPMNFHGYVSVPVSLLWSVLIFLFMKYLFLPLKHFIGKLPKGLAGAITFFLSLIFLADISLNAAFLLY